MGYIALRCVIIWYFNMFHEDSIDFVIIRDRLFLVFVTPQNGYFIVLSNDISVVYTRFCVRRELTKEENADVDVSWSVLLRSYQATLKHTAVSFV